MSIVATSNFHPDELYPNGLHRDRILPAIELLNDRHGDRLRRQRRRLPPAHARAGAALPHATQAGRRRGDERGLPAAGRGEEDDPLLRIEQREIHARRRAGGVVWFDSPHAVRRAAVAERLPSSSRAASTPCCCRTCRRCRRGWRPRRGASPGSSTCSTTAASSSSCRRRSPPRRCTPRVRWCTSSRARSAAARNAVGRVHGALAPRRGHFADMKPLSTVLWRRCWPARSLSPRRDRRGPRIRPPTRFAPPSASAPNAQCRAAIPTRCQGVAEPSSRPASSQRGRAHVAHAADREQQALGFEAERPAAPPGARKSTRPSRLASLRPRRARSSAARSQARPAPSESGENCPRRCRQRSAASPNAAQGRCRMRPSAPSRAQARSAYEFGQLRPRRIAASRREAQKGANARASIEPGAPGCWCRRSGTGSAADQARER